MTRLSNDARFLKLRTAAEERFKKTKAGFRNKVNRKAYTPEQARKIIENRPLPPNIWQPNENVSPKIIAGNTVTGPASIVELASALNNNVDLIYQWVHDNIEFHPTFGTQKSPEGTILDGIGNSFDQSALLVALLRQAGYTANFIFGSLQITGAQAANWLNVDISNYTIAPFLLSEGGIANDYSYNGDGSLASIWFSHCWVQVTISGVLYAFDPSFKTYTYKTSANLATAMGYNRSTFMAGVDSCSGAQT